MNLKHPHMILAYAVLAAYGMASAQAHVKPASPAITHVTPSNNEDRETFHDHKHHRHHGRHHRRHHKHHKKHHRHGVHHHDAPTPHRVKTSDLQVKTYKIEITLRIDRDGTVRIATDN